MRDINPNFTSTSNMGGPFAPVVVGGSLKMSYDSFLFTDGTKLGSAIRLFLNPASIAPNLKVYLKITFTNSAFFSADIINGSDWWDGYPDIIKYKSDSKKIEDQTELYAPIFSIYNPNSKAVYGKYVTSSAAGGDLIIYRHMTTNLMLMQACKFYFLLPAPFAPEIP